MTDSNTITKVDPKVFVGMKTDQGITVDELCQKGCKVLLYFVYSVGCAFCQGRIDELYNMYDSITKLNVVPILLYNDDSKDYKEFIEKNKRNDNYDVFLSMPQENLTKVFNIQPLPKFYFSVHYFKEKFRLEKLGITTNKTVMSKVPKQLATAFVIDQNKIISEYRSDAPDERFDWTKIIIDPENFGISVGETSSLDCTYTPIKKKKKSILRSLKIKSLDSEKLIEKNKEFIEKEKPLGRKRYSLFTFSKRKVEQNEEITLNLMLKVDYYRKYFKIHLANEFAVENLLFYEEVQNYKLLNEEDRKERCIKIIDVFLTKDSNHEINTLHKFIAEVKKKKDSGDIDLFKKIEDEIIQNCFVDAFIRMQSTDIWVQMTSKKKKLKSFYLLLNFVKIINFYFVHESHHLDYLKEMKKS